MTAPAYMEGLREYSVELIEDDSTDSILFQCWAENQEHAKEQAESAYPDCNIIAVD